MAQKLSPTAKRMKSVRDKRAAMTADRKKKKLKTSVSVELLKKRVKTYVVKIMTIKQRNLQA